MSDAPTRAGTVPGVDPRPGAATPARRAWAAAGASNAEARVEAYGAIDETNTMIGLAAHALRGRGGHCDTADHPARAVRGRLGDPTKPEAKKPIPDITRDGRRARRIVERWKPSRTPYATGRFPASTAAPPRSTSLARWRAAPNVPPSATSPARRPRPTDGPRVPHSPSDARWIAARVVERAPASMPGYATATIRGRRGRGRGDRRGLRDHRVVSDASCAFCWSTTRALRGN